MSLLIDISSDTSTALYLRVARGLENTIRKGQLSHGDQLPSVRELATTLQISRNTVLKAIKVLKETGMLSAVGGSTVRVASNLEPQFPAPSIARGASVTQYLTERIDSLLSQNGKRILSANPDQISGETQLRAVTKSKDTSMVYNPPANCFMDLRNTLDPRGLLELRIAIAALLRKRISKSVSCDNVFIFSSRELLLNTLCKLILEPSDKIAFSKSTKLLDLMIMRSFVETSPFQLNERVSKETALGIKLHFIVASDYQNKSDQRKSLDCADYNIVDQGDVVLEHSMNWSASVQSCTIHIGNLFSSPRSRTSCYFAVAPIELTSVLLLAKNQMDRHWSPLQQESIFDRLRRQSGRSVPPLDR